MATRFVLAQGTYQATKANFVVLAKKIGIAPSYCFYMSPSAVFLLQDFSPTTTDPCYSALTVYLKPSKLPLL